MVIIRQLFLFLLFPFSCTTYAALTHWVIVSNESNLTFTATQNGAPVNGSFKKLTGDIFFDPSDLAKSKATIIVDIQSLATSYQVLTNTLKTSDWFDVKAFPNATFISTKFTKMGQTAYVAKGLLTIRDKTVPVSLQFTQIGNADDHAKVKGGTIIKRNDFGVGQGEWSSVNEIKDNVEVNFILSVKKKT